MSGKPSLIRDIDSFTSSLEAAYVVCIEISFEYISERLNCKIINTTFPKRYGGNIRVLMVPEPYSENFNNYTKYRIPFPFIDIYFIQDIRNN